MAKSRAAFLVARALAALSLGVLATTALVQPAVAEPTSPTASGALPNRNELYAFQTRLNVAAERILEAGGAGTASIVASPQNRELRVYWPGEIPASVRTLAGRLNVPVAFLPARFSHTALATEAKRLAADARVVEAAPQADGSGLAVTVGLQLQQADQASLRANTQMPLTITTGLRPRALYNRQADTEPFWGGSRFTTAIGSCTNGFPIRFTASQSLMMSAGHCGSNGTNANIPGQPTPTGTVLGKNTCRDTLLIKYPAGLSPFIYTGPSNSNTEALVADTASDFVGNLVATGGASSGEHLDIPVQAVDVFVNIPEIPCTATGPLTRAGYATATCAAAPGDSGGPVYSYSGETLYSHPAVLARGTITAADVGSATCPGTVATGGRTVWYAPLVRPAGDPQTGSLAFYGYTILTCCPTVTVPDLLDTTVSEASAILFAAGLRVGRAYEVIDYTCTHIGDVTGQLPAAGDLVFPGTPVKLWIGKIPPRCRL